MPSLRNSIVISMYVLLPSVLMAENGEDAVTNAVGQSLWGLLKQGGWAMWPLGLCCLFVIYLAIYCWRGTVRKEFIPDMILPQVSDYLTIRRLEDSVALLKTLGLTGRQIGRLYAGRLVLYQSVRTFQGSQRL